MRVTLVTRIFAPEPAAAAFRLTALVRALTRRGDDVLVLTTRPPRSMDGRSPALPDRVHVRRAPVLRDRAGYVRGYLQYLSFDVPAFFRLLFGRRPELVIVEPPPTTGAVVRIACAIRRVPYVYFAADIWSDAAGGLEVSSAVVRTLRAVERFALRGAALVLAAGDDVRNRVHDIAGDCEVAIATHGIDVAVFAPDGPGGERFDLVYAGIASERHGAEVFVRAMPRVLEAEPGTRLLFVGHGSDWERMNSLAVELGVAASIEFRPVVPPEEVAALFRSARVALASLRPGQGYDYAFPTKILASAGTGTPVLFAGAGPTAEVVASARLGWVAGYDPALVADGLVQALRERPFGEPMTELVQWVAANGSLDQSADRTAAAVHRVPRSADG